MTNEFVMLAYNMMFALTAYKNDVSDCLINVSTHCWVKQYQNKFNINKKNDNSLEYLPIRNKMVRHQKWCP